MAERFYLDTCIWRDYFENRSDNLRPIGEWAFELIKKIVREKHIIVYSDVIDSEIKKDYSDIDKILSIVPITQLLNVTATTEQVKKAIRLTKEKNIHFKDAVHIILAKENNAILVSRDKHFFDVDILVKKPEELI